MSKHTLTPGPWIVTDDVSAHVIRGAETPQKQGDFDFVFRDYVCSIWGGYHEANARLIAAAPDLLAALERLIASDEAHETMHAPDGDDVARMIEYAAAFDNARAAIAKATGATA